MGVIVIPSPSMAVHSYNVPGWKYQMYNTWFLDRNEEMQHVADWTTAVASGAPGGSLRCLIFNCHGRVGLAKLSDSASLTAVQAPKFSQMKGLVNHIIIVACSVIGVQFGDNDNFWSDGGVNLCYQLAQQTGAWVYAANQPQYVDLSSYLFGGSGDIDDLEGYILAMPPSGAASWLGSNDDLSLRLRTM